MANLKTGKYWFVYLAMLFCMVATVAAAPRGRAISAQNYSHKLKLLTHGNGSWGPLAASHWGWEIYFKRNGKLNFRYIGEGGQEYKAAYKLKGNQIRIWITENIDNPPNYYKRIARMRCRILQPKRTLRYKYALACDNGMKFWSKAHKLIGRKRVVGGVRVITDGNYLAHVTTNANFRRRPHLKAGRLYCALGSVASDVRRKRTPYLPKNWEIFVLARTAARERIGKWNAYWYYVDVIFDGHSGEDCKQAQGWVYGQFVKRGRSPRYR